MTLAAFDLGTKCGVALWGVNNDRATCTTWNLTPPSHRGDGYRFWALRHELMNLTSRLGARDDPITSIVFEAPFIHLKRPGNAIIWGGLRGVLLMYCETHGIKYLELANNTLKKHFAGHGFAKKTTMIDVARQFGYNPKTDDEADALGLLHYLLVKERGTAQPAFTLTGENTDGSTNL